MRSLKHKIIFGVLGSHFFLLVCLLIHHFSSHRFKAARPIAVKVYSPPAPSIPPPPKKEAHPAPAKAAAPKPAAPKTAPTAKPKPSPSKENSPPKKDKIAQEIAKSLDVLKSESKQSRQEIKVPSKLQADLPPSSIADPTYPEFLIAFLQTNLELPELGTVKVKLEIDRFGHLVDCEVLEAQSKKNAEALKNQLPTLAFPCLNDYGIREASETFTITFKNVENP